jgi:effector-binding domain-containing protein
LNPGWTTDRVTSGRIVQREIPAADLAVVTHKGPFSDLDRADGGLGLWVTERALAAPGPVRERYLPLGDPRDLLNHTTEVCWPVRLPT